MPSQQVKKAIELAAQECLRKGLTSVHEAKVFPIRMQAFEELIQQNRPAALGIYGTIMAKERNI